MAAAAEDEELSIFPSRLEDGSWATRMNMDYPGLRVISEDPPIHCVDDFLTDAEIEQLIAMARPQMVPAPVVAAGPDKRAESRQRTSSTSYLPKYDTEWLTEKVHNLTNKPIADMERPQVNDIYNL